MKRFTVLVAASLVLATALTANATTYYYDLNDNVAGSGIVDQSPSNPWDTTTPAWNPNADGSGAAAGTTVPWVNGNDAVFAAGTDTTGILYGLVVASGVTANSALLEEGALQMVSGAINTGTGTFAVGTGIGSTATFVVNASPTTATNGAGTIQLHGGTYRMITTQTVAHSFISATKNLEINEQGTIDFEEGGAVGVARVAIYAGTILGTGGTTSAGTGTMIVKSDQALGGEVRFQGAGMANSTFQKLKVQGYVLYRLGNSGGTSEFGFGAAPASALADAITLDGGALGTSFSVTLNANRGITLASGGGWFNNSASTMTVPSLVSGPGSLNKDVDANLIKGTATASGRLNLTRAAGNTYGGGSNLNAGSLFVSNTSGSGTGTGPVIVGGSSTTQFGTLLGTGSISGLTTLNQFGEIQPGGTTTTDNAGTLTLNGGLKLNAGSLLTYQMGPTGNDKTVIGGVNGLNIAGPMTMNILANGTITAAGQFPVLDYDTSFVGSLSDITLTTAALAPGFTYSLVNNPANTSIDFKITAPGGLPGDYNNNGVVDASDYVLWRKTPGAYGGDPAGYNTWRANFSSPPGAGSGGGLMHSAVPEPASIVLLVSTLGFVFAGRRRTR